MRNYTVHDAVGSLLATLVFVLVLYAPGYIAGYGVDLFGFRGLSLVRRSAWAVALSFAVSPIAAHLLGRSLGLMGVCWAFALAGSGCLFLLLRDAPNLTRGMWRVPAWIAVGWTLFALLMLIDLQIGHKLYFSVVMADQSYRIAFTDAVVRTGVPPANPLYFAGTLAPMRYYYFWYVLCAVVVKLAHVSAAQAFVASSVWAGFGLLAITDLFSCYFFTWERSRRWMALGLLAITGADLLPAVGQALLQPTLNGDTEWWSVDPIDSWPDSLLWVPHHVASVLCCMLAFLFLWQRGDASRKIVRAGTVFAALAFASACGLSVYVAFGFGLLTAAWLLWSALHREAHAALFLRRTAGAALLSVLLLAPFFLELTRGTGASSGRAGNAPAARAFSLSVRRMIDSELVTGFPVFAHLRSVHPVLLDQGMRLLLLAPGLVMELGLYGAVLVWLFRARRKPGIIDDPARSTAIFFTVAGLVMTMFLSSSVITNNDFGYRAVMLPQFFLLLLTADLLGSWRRRDRAFPVNPIPWRRRVAFSLALLGMAGTLYWAFLLRAWLPLEAAHKGSGFEASAEDEFQIRQALEDLHRLAPANAVVAFRPIDPTPDRQGAVMVPNEYYQRMLVMDTGRQMLNAEGKCAVHFGGDPGACPAIQSAVARLYALPVPDAHWAREFCAHFGVQYLVLSAWDPTWHTSSGWPVTLPPVVQEPRFRVLACATGESRPASGL